MKGIWTILLLVWFYHTGNSQSPLLEKMVRNTAERTINQYDRHFIRTLKNGNTLLMTNAHSYGDEFMDTSMISIKIYNEDANLVSESRWIFTPFLFLSELSTTDDGGFACSGRLDTNAVILYFDQLGELKNQIVVNDIRTDEVLKSIIKEGEDIYVASEKHHFKKYEHIDIWNPYYPFDYDLFYYDAEILVDKINLNGEIIWSTAIDTTEIIYQQYAYFINTDIDSSSISNPLLLENVYMYNYDYTYSFTNYPVLKKHPSGNGIFYYNPSYTTDMGYDSLGNWHDYFNGDYKIRVVDFAGNITACKSLSSYKNLDYDSLNTPSSGELDGVDIFDSVIIGLSSFQYYPNEFSYGYYLKYYCWDYNGNLIDSFTRDENNTSYFDFPPVFNGYYPYFTSSDKDVVYAQYSNYLYDPDNEQSLEESKVNIFTYGSDLINKRIYSADLMHKDLENVQHFFETPDHNYLCILKPYYSWDSLLFCKVSTGYNEIKYAAYIDINKNGVFDAGDSRAVQAKIEVTHNNSSLLVALNTAGTTSLNVTEGQYISRLVSYTQKLSLYTIIPDSVITYFDSIGLTDSVIFRLVPKNDFQDLQVSITPQNIPRPGFQSSYRINYSNHGTDTAYNIRITFLKDSLQHYDSATLAENIFSGDTLIKIVDLLYRLQSNNFTVNVINSLPPALNMNDTVKLSATINNRQLDSVPADNYFLLKQGVRNSFDPNDKSESHGAALTTAELNKRDYLYYTIRFQNTGNDYAYRVVVKDTLSEKLDWKTLEMVTSSHDSYILDVKDKRYLTWTFDNIYLPDSTSNEKRSHGYISFRIKPKVGLSVNDVISNRASIIFDYNEAIVTNTVSTSIIDERVTLVHNHEIKTLMLYPTPTSGNVTLEMNITEPGNYELQLTDITGQLIYNESLNLSAGAFSKQINLENMSSEIYLIGIYSDKNEVYSGKILKQ